MSLLEAGGSRFNVSSWMLTSVAYIWSSTASADGYYIREVHMNTNKRREKERDGRDQGWWYREYTPFLEIPAGSWSVRQISCSWTSSAFIKYTDVCNSAFRDCCINIIVSCSVIRAHRTCMARTLSPSHSGCSVKMRRHSSICGVQDIALSLLSICETLWQ